jgi:acetyltransferase EpsM
MASLFIYGAGGHSKVVIDAARKSGFLVDYVIDSDPKKHGKTFQNAKIINEDTSFEPDSNLIVAVGDNAVRAMKYDYYGKQVNIAKVIHPNALVASSASVGNGSVLFARAVLNAGAKVGENAVINTGAIIEHDCVIDDHAQICPGAVLTGGVQVGEGAFVSAGATVIPGIKIGQWSVIAAGSVVIEDVPDGVMVAGCPAKLKRKAVQSVK